MRNWVLGLMVAVLVLGGCSSDDDDDAVGASDAGAEVDNTGDGADTGDDAGGDADDGAGDDDGEVTGGGDIDSSGDPLEGDGPVVNATLAGVNQVGEGDDDGSGVAQVVRSDTDQVCFTLAVEKIGTLVGAHIHEGGADVNGDIVVDFGIGETEISEDDPTAIRDCVGADPAVLDAVFADPDGYYVNVHSAELPAGAVRGQLVLVRD